MTVFSQLIGWQDTLFEDKLHFVFLVSQSMGSFISDV